MHSERLLALARLTNLHPKHGYALLELAIAEGAVRLLDREGYGGSTQGLPANIPRQIVQYWHAETWPDDVRQAILKLRGCNPEMVCTIFHEQAAREFITEHFGKDLRSLFDFCFHHTMKSDLFRLCYLHVHGGIYIDVDISCHEPLEKIFVNDAFRCFLFYAEGKPWCIENGFIATEPGTPLIGTMIRNLERNLVNFRDHQEFRGIWAETGPGLATETTMGLLAGHILSGLNSLAMDGFLTSRNDRCAVSYHHDELQYKQTAEGNWRKARPPPGMALGSQ